MGGGRTYNYKTRQNDYEPINRSFVERVETEERMMENDRRKSRRQHEESMVSPYAVET